MRGLAYVLIIAGLSNIFTCYSTISQFSNRVISLEWMIAGLLLVVLGGGLEYCLIRNENDRLKMILSNTVVENEKTPANYHQSNNKNSYPSFLKKREYVPFTQRKNP